MLQEQQVQNNEQSMKSFKAKYSVKQSSMMNIAMLVAAIGFAIICGVGYGVSILWKQLDYGTINQSDAVNNINIVYSVASVGLILSSILSVIWMFRVHKASYLFSFITISIYCLSNGAGFGSLFYVLEVREILSVFGLVAIILLGTYIISTVLSVKGIMTLSKIAYTVFFIYLFGSMFTLLPMLLLPYSSQLIILVISEFVGGFLSVIYLILTFYSIQKSNEFIQENELRNKIAIFNGFLILMNLMALIWRIVRIYLYFKE